MTTGTMLIIIGIVLLVISVVLWLFFFIPGKRLLQKKVQILVREYGCKG